MSLPSSHMGYDNPAAHPVNRQPSDPQRYQQRLSKVVTLKPYYKPQPISLMEISGDHQGLWLPSPNMMQRAFRAAVGIRESDHPKAVQDSYYSGIDFDSIPTSESLTKDAEQGLVDGGNCYFHDFLTAEYYRGALRPEKRAVDPTVPLTTITQKAHVQLLIKAFNNTRDCSDNAQMIRPFLEKRHDPKLVEVLCWGILKACIMRSVSDEPLLAAYEPAKAKNSPGVSSFADRYDAVVKSMSRSKTICKHLYDPPYVNVFVDDPVRAVRRVDANRDLNRQKGQIMGRGKQLLEEEVKVRGGSLEPRGRKRRAITTEGQDMPTDNQTPKHRTLAVRGNPTSQGDAQGSDLVSENGLQYTPMSNFMSPVDNIKQEDGSPRGLANSFRTPATPVIHSRRNFSDQMSMFDEFDPCFDLAYENNQSSAAFNNSRHLLGQNNPQFSCGVGHNHNSASFIHPQPSLGLSNFQSSISYGHHTFGNELGRMGDLFALNHNQLRQPDYTTYRNGPSFAPMDSRVTASTPNTPSAPGLNSGDVSNVTPMTPSKRGFAIPDYLDTNGEDQNANDDGGDFDAEVEGADAS